MVLANSKKWSNLKDPEKISYCDGLLKGSVGNLSKKHIEWYLNRMFLDGNHYATYNTVTHSLETKPRNKHEVRMVINTTKSKIRSIKNYATRQEPKWDIIPGDIDEETIKNARRGGKVMDYLYRHLHLEQTVDGVVDSILNTSIAWVELDWDSEAEGGMGQVKIIFHDSFDIYPDVSGKLYAGKYVGRYLAKSTRRAVDAIKADKRYKDATRKKVVKDDDIAESPIKARILRKEMAFSDAEEENIEKATVKEFLLWDDEPEEGKGNIHLFTYSGKEVLRDEVTDFSEYPLYLCQIEMNPNRIYQRSWTADAIPINKAIDRFVSQKIMYVNKALIYRIIAEKGAYQGRITTSQGEIIEIAKGRKFNQMAMSPLPADIDSLLGQLDRYQEDVLSAHEASMGALPAGARSGKTLEALQAAEANSLAGINRSLRSFLEVIGKRILEIAADKYVASRIVKISDPESETEGEAPGEARNYLKVIGEGAESKPKGSTIIYKDNELIVTIGSWLGHTREAQRETILELAQVGFLPAEEVLRQFEFPNINELSKKAREQRLEEHELKADIAGRRGGGEGGQPTQSPTDEMVRLADQENMQMMNGEVLPPTEGADLTHTQSHLDFMKTDVYKSASTKVKDTIRSHAEGETQYSGFEGR